MSNNEKQPMAVPNDLPAVWDLVIADMQERDKMGERNYGTRLQPHNGRSSLQDLTEELLDSIVYLYQLKYELKWMKVEIQKLIDANVVKSSPEKADFVGLVDSLMRILEKNAAILAD